MPKLYIKWAPGDAVYTDQVKLTPIFDFEAISAETYLEHIKNIAGEKKVRNKFKFRGKKNITEIPVIALKLKGKQFGPQLPTDAQLRKSRERIAAENKIKVYQIEKRLSRRNGWEYLEVSAIAAAAYMKGMQAALGNIPEELWDKKAQEAMEEARKSIQDWQDYEVNNLKKMTNDKGK